MKRLILLVPIALASWSCTPGHLPVAAIAIPKAPVAAQGGAVVYDPADVEKLLHDTLDSYTSTGSTSIDEIELHQWPSNPAMFSFKSYYYESAPNWNMAYKATGLVNMKTRDVHLETLVPDLTPRRG